MKDLKPVIEVNADKCVNCHKCISACPVKFANNGSLDHVSINVNLCIGCGECLKACTHNARTPIDDFKEFLSKVAYKERFIIVAAPAVAAQFPSEYLKLNAWLGSLGAQAFFDVSFGAELTVKSYLEYVKHNNPTMVIAQPCPVIVSFIEIYKPNLLKYLAPADSPMVHTIKMIKNYYKEYSEYQIVVISPCLAKTREFEELGLPVLNVTMASIANYLKEKDIKLSDYPDLEYNNSSAERAVLFSTPGGLMRTALRENPVLADSIRKMEGPHSIYKYLAYLQKDIDRDISPLLLDCLNCDAGCNGGTGTTKADEPLDSIEAPVEERARSLRKKYGSHGLHKSQKLEKLIDQYWKPGLYNRSYVDRSENFKESVMLPSLKEIEELYHSMKKYKKEDIRNCGSCGYGRCEKMAVAVHNGLNKIDNCHFYIQEGIITERNNKGEVIDKLSTQVETVYKTVKSLVENIENFTGKISGQFSVIENSLSGLKDIAQGVTDIDKITQSRIESVSALVGATESGASTIVKTNKIIHSIAKSGDEILNLISFIDDIVAKTGMLSMNASIQAAHAGDAGKGFAVVAHEIRTLATNASASTENITRNLKEMLKSMEVSLTLSGESGKALELISTEVHDVEVGYKDLSENVVEIASKAKVVLASLKTLTELSGQVQEESTVMKNYSEEIINSLKNMLES